MFAICPFEIADRERSGPQVKRKCVNLFQIKAEMLIFKYKAPEP